MISDDIADISRDLNNVMSVEHVTDQIHMQREREIVNDPTHKETS